MLIIVIVISSSTVPVRTLATSHRRFCNLIRTLGRTLLVSDQPISRASTYTGQHNTKTQRQTLMPRAEFEPTTPVTMRKTYVYDRAATGTGVCLS
jgi:hypothetical protein